MLTSLILISLAIQFFFFIFAYTFKTDKLTDLSYGLTFIILSAWLFFSTSAKSQTQLILLILISLWGFRLAGYLLYRIMKIKRDKRFDQIRGNFFKFLGFWFFQGLSVSIILLPSMIVFTSKTHLNFSVYNLIGLIIMLTGLIIETIADLQKFSFKLNPKNKGRFINTGLWRYSRHPNYYGEILVWLGLFIYSLKAQQGISWFSIVSPVYITILLMFFSGIPTLEKKYRLRYKHNSEYQKYLKTTSKLVLLPKRSV